MSPDEPKLPLQAEKVLPYTIRPHLLAYCSRTDLFAVVNDEEVVDVYRLGGQKAFSVKRKTPSNTVVGLKWIRDGKCLAVALSTGNVDIVSGETGKIVRHGGDDPFSNDASGSQQTPGAITCLGWGTTLTENATSVKRNSRLSQEPTEVIADSGLSEEWYDTPQGDLNSGLLGRGTAKHDSRTKDAMLDDLPRQLAFIDVESVLPRLSPIPTRANAGGRYDMFATQSALDDYFNSMQRKDRLAADVMLIGHQHGIVRLVIDDIVEVGLDNRRASGTPKEYLRYSSHPQSPFHALLRAQPDQNEMHGGSISYKDLSLSLFDIPLLSSGGSHLHLIVSRTAQVRDLCSYISYSIICAKSDWTTNTNLPSRFMDNVNETLQEKGEGTIEQNLFHLAMTGNFTPTILEWLKDELAERGHKRWDHAMTTLYVELGKIFQTNLLPVLERCIVVATNLRGLARYYEGGNKFDVSPDAFTSIIDALSMLQLLVREAIQVLGEEQRQFRAFSKWLRHEIDLAAADPESISAKDMAEREASNLDYPRILAYLEGALTQSRLQPIVHAQTNDEGQVNQRELLEAIQQARFDKAERKDLLSLHTLSTHLNTVCKTAHSQILRWQNSARPSIDEIELDPAAISETFDMRMVCDGPNAFRTIILSVTQKEKNQISIHVVSKATSAISTPQKAYFFMNFPPSASITTLKILSDDHFIVLLSRSEKGTTHYHLLRLPINASQEDFTDLDVLGECIIHTFPLNGGFVPVEIVVGEKKGGMNVTVLEEGFGRWKTFDLEEVGVGAGAALELSGESFIDSEDEEEEEGMESMIVE